MPFYAYPVSTAASVSLNREFTPLEAHLILWHIEQGLMPRETGKRREWTIAQLDGDPFHVALQDYDWADEVLHAQIGRRWLESEFPTPAERKAAADGGVRPLVGGDRALRRRSRPSRVVARARRAGAQRAPRPRGRGPT